MTLAAALVVFGVFCAIVRALASAWGARPELGPPLPPVRPRLRRARFAGEVLGGRR